MSFSVAARFALVVVIVSTSCTSASIRSTKVFEKEVVAGVYDLQTVKSAFARTGIDLVEIPNAGKPPAWMKGAEPVHLRSYGLVSTVRVVVVDDLYAGARFQRSQMIAVDEVPASDDREETFVRGNVHATVRLDDQDTRSRVLEAMNYLD